MSHYSPQVLAQFFAGNTPALALRERAGERDSAPLNVLGQSETIAASHDMGYHLYEAYTVGYGPPTLALARQNTPQMKERI